MVGTFKQLFRKSVGLALLEWDELATAVTEIEAIINARPLTAQASEAGGVYPLTPAELLLGSGPSLTADPVPHTEVDPALSRDDLSDQDRHRREQVENWWSRWQTDYLTELTQFHS